MTCTTIWVASKCVDSLARLIAQYPQTHARWCKHKMGMGSEFQMKPMALLVHVGYLLVETMCCKIRLTLKLAILRPAAN